MIKNIQIKDGRLIVAGKYIVFIYIIVRNLVRYI